MDATLERDGGRYVLMVRRSLAHPPEKVWRVVTERDLLKQWFPSDVEGDWEVGSTLAFHFLHGEGDSLSEEDLRGEVLAVDPPRLLEFRWGTHQLKFELEAEGDGCLFRLSEAFDDPSLGARDAAGWEMCLDNLQLVIDGAAAAKFAVDVWKEKFHHYVRKFEPDFGTQDNPMGSDDHPLLREETPDETR